MKTVRVEVREISKVTYEIEVDDDVNINDHRAIEEILWDGGYAPPPLETECEDESIDDVYEVRGSD